MPYSEIMEDQNILAADCIVISCCCQCLILQILILILLKLPYKLFRKTKKYAKRLRNRRSEGKIVQIEMRRFRASSFGSHGGSFRIQLDGFFPNDECGHHMGFCMNEVEGVLEEFSSKGEFAFGSFWSGEGSKISFPSCLVGEEEIDYGHVQSHLIDVFGSSSINSS